MSEDGGSDAPESADSDGGTGAGGREADDGHGDVAGDNPSANVDGEMRDDDPPSRPEPTPQSEAFRRQQRRVGIGVALLGGVAVVAATLQRFPGYPLFVYALAGIAATALLFGLVVAGLFPGSATDSE